MSRKPSLAFQMKQTALKDITDDHTAKVYKRAIERFVGFAKSNEIKSYDSAFKNKELVQTYADSMAGCYSPSTIHTYIAPVCKGLGLSMSDINKPVRSASSIVRGRTQTTRGTADENNPKYQRLIEFQKAVGIRRDELRRLEYGSFCRDESGYLCVDVLRGKGGKHQLQRILPQHEAQVIRLLSEKNSGRVFSNDEMSNHINLHKLRSTVAKEAYNYYTERLINEPKYQRQLMQEIVDRGKAFNPKKMEKLYHELGKGLKSPVEYKLRGDNAEIAKKLGLPLTYDRVALMAVSVFHLSHWRADVTVTNYLLQ